MKKRLLTAGIVLFLTMVLGSVAPVAFGADGYISFRSHAEIVEKARQEKRLKVFTTMDPETSGHLKKSFQKRYPFMDDIQISEIAGTAPTQRLLLQIQGGKPDADVVYTSEDFFNQFIPYGKKFDLFAMAQQRVLDIPLKMIDAGSRKALALSTHFGVVAFNKCRLTQNQIPERWEDFLKPEFKDKKFVVDIRPFVYQSFAAGAGEEWMIDFATKIAAQNPIWFRGATRALTLIANGEFLLHSAVNYNSTVRAMRKDKTGCLAFRIVEPAPVRLAEPEIILETAPHPHAGLLWVEFMASPEAQAFIDKYEPLKSSLYVTGSAVEKALRGKKIWLKEWKHYEKGPHWMSMAVKTFGFPKAEKRRRR